MKIKRRAKLTATARHRSRCHISFRSSSHSSPTDFAIFAHIYRTMCITEQRNYEHEIFPISFRPGWTHQKTLDGSVPAVPSNTHSPLFHIHVKTYGVLSRASCVKLALLWFGYFERFGLVRTNLIRYTVLGNLGMYRVSWLDTCDLLYTECDFPCRFRAIQCGLSYPICFGLSVAGFRESWYVYILFAIISSGNDLIW